MADVLPFNNLRDNAAAFVFNNIHKIPKRQPESSFCPFSFAEARKLAFRLPSTHNASRRLERIIRFQPEGAWHADYGEAAVVCAALHLPVVFVEQIFHARAHG